MAEERIGLTELDRLVDFLLSVQPSKQSEDALALWVRCLVRNGLYSDVQLKQALLDQLKELECNGVLTGRRVAYWRERISQALESPAAV